MDEKAQKITNPKAGYRFTEMFNFWVHVLYAVELGVIAESSDKHKNDRHVFVPHYFPDAAAFAKKYEYKTIPGAHWIWLCGSDGPKWDRKQALEFIKGRAA